VYRTRFSGDKIYEAARASEAGASHRTKPRPALAVSGPRSRRNRIGGCGKSDQGRQKHSALGQDQLPAVRGQPGPAEDRGSGLQPPAYDPAILHLGRGRCGGPLIG
jgi:hypothetical protein